MHQGLLETCTNDSSETCTNDSSETYTNESSETYTNDSSKTYTNNSSETYTNDSGISSTPFPFIYLVWKTFLNIASNKLSTVLKIISIFIDTFQTLNQRWYRKTNKENFPYPLLRCIPLLY